jgi:hypothetical protein
VQRFAICVSDRAARVSPRVLSLSAPLAAAWKRCGHMAAVACDAQFEGMSLSRYRIRYRPVRTGQFEESYPELAPLLATPCDFVIYYKSLRTLPAHEGWDMR